MKMHREMVIVRANEDGLEESATKRPVVKGALRASQDIRAIFSYSQGPNAIRH